MRKDNPACFECPKGRAGVHTWRVAEDGAVCVLCKLSLTKEQAADCFSERQLLAYAGWTVDGDGWFKRPRTSDDPAMEGMDDLGFTTDDEIYVASSADALLYDRGVLTFEAKRSKNPSST